MLPSLQIRATRSRATSFRATTVHAVIFAIGISVARASGLVAQAKPAAAPNSATTVLPHVDATVSSHNVQRKYSGVLLGELLKLVGRPVGEALRGKALATVVSVEAADNYKVVFALAEVDSGFTSKVIFLADRKNGAPIDASEGPFRVIVPDEARPARWAKQVVRVRLVPVE
ncbi:MAG TPA: molybdopterin-dependent oxidoreductase [Gemmatimonadaceae bacterium]|jgi:hypothetical protein